jgi:hypothetical protein
VLVDVEDVDEFDGAIYDAVECPEALAQPDGSLPHPLPQQGLVVIARYFSDFLDAVFPNEGDPQVQLHQDLLRAWLRPSPER